MNTIELTAHIFDGTITRGTPVSASCVAHEADCPDPAFLVTPIGHVTGLTPGRYEQRLRIRMLLPDSFGDPWDVVPPSTPPDTRCVPGGRDVTCNLEPPAGGLPFQKETTQAEQTASDTAYCVKYPTSSGCLMFIARP